MTETADASGKGSLVATSRAARLAMREVVRRDLVAARAALRSEREAAAAAAQSRPPRWRPARSQIGAILDAETVSGPEERPAAMPASEAQARISAPSLQPNDPAEALSPEPSSVFASIIGGLASPGPVAAEVEPVTLSETDAPAMAVASITALGPGMLARLRLLGYERLSDLADAQPAELRDALGEISRLLNVEGWIAEARRLARHDTA